MSDFDTCEKLSEIYPVSRETFERLTLYVERLGEWQKKTNLVASSTLDGIWTRHIADSLQCAAIKPEALCWLDLGSGGGLPAMVIAAVLAEKRGGRITLVESNRKKTVFLRQVNRQMNTNAKVLTSRIEEVELIDEVPEVVTARALTALPQLLDLASPWLEKGAVGLFHKGREYQRELANCDGLWQFDLVCHESRTAAGSVMLEISNLQRV
ncbi:MAG: 16S rRNA (guanine(527)-N(7))-methyltransferase RsmG [Rhizobiaceae bacterium]